MRADAAAAQVSKQQQQQLPTSFRCSKLQSCCLRGRVILLPFSSYKMPPKKAAAPAALPRFGRVRNNLKMGLVGLPNVGKSSLFNLLTQQAVAAENYPFCTVDPNESRCPVPDERYEWLCKVWKPPSEQPAYLHITDIAGLIRGAHEGAGLGNAFLSHIQAVDGIFHIVRAFESDEIVHVDDTIHPTRDLDTIQSELCKKDLAYVAMQQEARQKDVRKNPQMKLPPLYFQVMEKVTKLLENNKSLSGAEWTAPEIEKINELLPGAITTKPVVYLVNLSKHDFIRRKNKHLIKIKRWIDEHGGGQMIPFSVEYESELWSLRDSPDQRAALIAECKGADTILPKITTAGYFALKLMYYFTAGEKEVRCWTVQSGATAPQAAGVIHTDFEKGFIKAEVCSFEDYKQYSEGQKSGGMAKVKAAGKYRTEGKSYIVQDGDIIFFQFNVSKGKGKK